MWVQQLCVRTKFNTLRETDIKSSENQWLECEACFFYIFDLFFRVVKLLFVSGGFGSGVIFLPQPSDLQPGAPRTPAHRMMAMAA